MTDSHISLRFAVIGAGRLGSSLALAMLSTGATLVGFAAGSPEGEKRAEHWLGGEASDVASIVACSPDVYFLAVPDRAVPAVAAALATLIESMPSVTPPIVVHTSGATSVDALSACEDAGATVLVFHPLQTFTDPLTGRDRFAGTSVAVTPSSRDASGRGLKMGLSLAQRLAAKPFLLEDANRALYHAAATFACNYFVTLEHVASQTFGKAGLPRDDSLHMFLPLVRATLDNMAAQGTVGALTGPLSRGDVETVSAHLRTLRDNMPEIVDLYKALGRATLPLVRLRHEIPEPAVALLADALADGTSG